MGPGQWVNAPDLKVGDVWRGRTGPAGSARRRTVTAVVPAEGGKVTVVFNGGGWIRTVSPKVAFYIRRPEVVDALTWRRSTNSLGQRVYRADSDAGAYLIDGNGVPRMRWTVYYPDDTYGITDTMREAKAWAEVDLKERLGVGARK